jgi:hypothetical protein
VVHNNNNLVILRRVTGRRGAFGLQHNSHADAARVKFMTVYRRACKTKNDLWRLSDKAKIYTRTTYRMQLHFVNTPSPYCETFANMYFLRQRFSSSVTREDVTAFPVFGI